VADYLLAAFGLENLTPKSFSQAIEEELDVSPRVLLEVRQLISSKRIKLMVSNLQTGSKQVDELLALAKTEGIAVVELSELLPEGIGYIDWMENNIGAIEAALR
jgi:zinc/manganese transport system substrate-binding protein